MPTPKEEKTINPTPLAKCELHRSFERARLAGEQAPVQAGFDGESAWSSRGAFRCYGAERGNRNEWKGQLKSHARGLDCLHSGSWRWCCHLDGGVNQTKGVEAGVGSRLGLRISDSESKKPLSVGISANDILTIDGFLLRFSYKSGPRRPSPFDNSTKRLGRQILKVVGFSKPYCRIKWIFSSIYFPTNS